MVYFTLYDVLFTTPFTKQELMTAERSAEFSQTGKALLKVLSAFPEETFNTVPFEGSWTAAQVADHIVKSAGGTLQVLHGETEATGRLQDEHVEELAKTFLDFSLKMQSPESILPSESPLDKQETILSLEKLWTDLETAAATVDLSRLCTAFAFPGTGYLTGFEWVMFCMFHTQRHTHQLERIYDRQGIVERE